VLKKTRNPLIGGGRGTFIRILTSMRSQLEGFDLEGGVEKEFKVEIFKKDSTRSESEEKGSIAKTSLSQKRELEEGGREGMESRGKILP